MQYVMVLSHKESKNQYYMSCVSFMLIRSHYGREYKDPPYTKLTVMNYTISNSNLLASSSSGLGDDCFYIKPIDGTTWDIHTI